MIYALWDRFFDGDFEKNGKEVFRKHNAQIEALVPEERLLRYDVRQGWKPLCDFLEVDVPSQPFPSGNNMDSFHESCRSKDMIKAGRFASKLSTGIAVLAICTGVWWRMR